MIETHPFLQSLSDDPDDMILGTLGLQIRKQHPLLEQVVKESYRN